MEELKKLDSIDNISIPSKVDYYLTNNRKVSDFFLGFLGMIILFLLSRLIIINTTSSTNIYLVYIIGTFVYSFSVLRFFKINRRFIAIGILSILILGVLVFSYGLMILLTSHW